MADNAPINTCALPSIDLDADALQAAAGRMKSSAASVRSSGAAIKSTWAGLAGVYHAPESATLLAAMDPVATSTDAFADDATSVAGILEGFAAEAGPIAKAMATAKADAMKLGGKIAKSDDWREDDDLVNENNDLLHHINSTVVAYQAAERKAANQIEALIGGHKFHAIDPNADEKTIKQDNYAYGVSSIPDNASMPWGSKVEHKDGCFASTMTHVGHFFKGVGEGLWGMVTGIGSLLKNGLGFGGWDKFVQTWKGLGQLALLASPVLGMIVYGPKGYTQRLTNLGKQLIHWDEWKKDPSKAAGMTLTDIVTTIGTGGGGAAVKGGSTAGRLTKTTEAVSDASKAEKAADAAGATSKATKGVNASTRLLGKYGEIVKLPASVKIPRIDHVLAGMKTKLGELSQLRDGKAAEGLHDPHVHEPETPSAHLDDHGSGSPAHAPEREPALAGGGSHGAPEHGGDGPPASGAHGGDRPPASGGHSGGDGPLTSGGHSGGDGPPASGGHSGGDRPPATPGHQSPVSDGHGSRPSHEPPPVAHEVHEPAPTARAAFAARHDLAPNTAYHVAGRGTFFTDETGRVVHVETQAGTARHLNGDLLHPQPDVTYVVDGRHVYHTDAAARIDHVHVDELRLGDAYRSGSVTRRIGNAGGAEYEGGHLIARMFGGGTEDHNIVAMLREVNRGKGAHSFGNLERQWKTLLEQHPATKIKVEITPRYHLESKVPDNVVIKYSVDDGPTVTRKYSNG